MFEKQSTRWLKPEKFGPKRLKSQQFAGKAMASVFWDTCGILFIDYLKKVENDHRRILYGIIKSFK